MASWLLILLPVVAVAVHAGSLLAGRRGESMLQHLSFGSGLLGLAILPSVPLLVFLAMPLPVVGSARPGLEAFFILMVGSSAILLTSSFVLLVLVAIGRARRRDRGSV